MVELPFEVARSALITRQLRSTETAPGIGDPRCLPIAALVDAFEADAAIRVNDAAALVQAARIRTGGAAGEALGRVAT